MPLEALTPAHREALVDFLTSAFQLPKTAPFVDPRLLQWKYDEPRPDWPGSRSYAWMEDGQIAAHACLCPVTYRVGDREIKASYLIDWAAGRRSPGAGVLLLRKLASFFDVLLAIGGSKDTQQILPKLGYRLAEELGVFVRVLRPWRQFRTDPVSRGWKAPLRLGRNSIWSRAPVPAVPLNWGRTAISEFDSGHATLLSAGPTERTPELMNYWLRCRGAAMSAHLLRDRDGMNGWFVLSRIAGVMRIADLRMRSQDPEQWRAAYALASQAALADGQVCEFVAAASTPLAQDALRRNGFRLHHTEPIFALDPQNLLIGHAPLDIALIESDAAYLYAPDYPYLT
jgi:hypothetical protein